MGAGLVIVQIKNGVIKNIVLTANISYGSLIKTADEFEKKFGESMQNIVLHFKDREEFRKDDFDEKCFEGLESEEERKIYLYEIKKKEVIKRIVKVQDKFRKFLKKEHNAKSFVDKKNKIHNSIDLKFEEGWLEQICEAIISGLYVYLTY